MQGEILCVGRVRSEYRREPVGQVRGRGTTHPRIVLTQHMDENPRRNHEEANFLKSLKSERSSGIVGQATCLR